MPGREPKKYTTITRVLNLVNTPVDGTKARTFSIGWIRISGKAKGTFKFVPFAMKYISKIGGAPKPRKMPNLKEERLLLLEDIHVGTTFFVPIHTIIEFDGIPVRH